MYSRIYTRLNWFFDYIGEPEDEFEVELYGDVNFDGTLNVLDVVEIVGVDTFVVVHWYEKIGL